MDRLLKMHLKHMIKHHPKVTKNDMGDKTFGTPESRLCHKQEKFTKVKNAEGEEVLSEITLYFDGIFAITTDDFIEIDTRRYPVISYSSYEGLGTVHGTTVVYV